MHLLIHSFRNLLCHLKMMKYNRVMSIIDSALCQSCRQVRLIWFGLDFRGGAVSPGFH